MPPKSKKMSKVKKKKTKGKISKDTKPFIVEVTDEELALLSTDLQLPKEHLSPSSIGMYLRCPMQFFKRYVEGKKRPPGVSMVEGTTHHATCEFNNLRKVKTGKDRKEKQLIEHFCDTFHVNQKEIGDWEGIRERDVIIRGRKLQSQYINGFAKRLMPRSVEKEFVLMVGPVKILCYMDVSGTLTPFVKTQLIRDIVCDYKTAGRSKPDKEIENSLQLTTYGICDMMDRKTIKMPVVGMCVFKKTKTPAIEWQADLLHAGRINWFKRTVLSVADAISRGAFPVCDPVYNNLCSERWCGYWTECLGKCQS